MSENYETSKTSYLQTLQLKQETVNLMVLAAQQVTANGIEGIVKVANQQPEVLLTAIEMLVGVANQQQTELVKLADDWLTCLDEIDKLASVIDKE